MTRTPTIVLAWLLAVVGATAIGLLAVGAIGAGIVGPGLQPLSAADVEAQLASSTAAPTALPTVPPSVPPSVPPTGPPTSSPAPATGTAVVLTSAGGSVVARCTGGTVEVVSASPAQGYRLHDEGGEDPGRVRFESGGGRVEMRLSCAGGVPVSQVRTGG